MNICERQFNERLRELEKTITMLQGRVRELQREMGNGRTMPTIAMVNGSGLGSLFRAWRRTEMHSKQVRQNRRVERHAASLF
jgi:hypothetical protein